MLCTELKVLFFLKLTLFTCIIECISNIRNWNSSTSKVTLFGRVGVGNSSINQTFPERWGGGEA